MILMLNNLTLNQNPIKINRALISVFDKTGVVVLAQSLNSLGVEILSTGGTAKALRDANISVTDVSVYTKFPEIMDGRVKTIHPLVEGGILGLRDKHHLDANENNIQCNEINFTFEDIKNCDEAFVTGTFAGIIPVAKLENRELKSINPSC